MPPVLTLRRSADEQQRVPAEERAFRDLRPWMNPRDRGERAHQFVERAAARAFPPAPELQEYRIVHYYAYCHHAVSSILDPNGCDIKLWHRGKEYTGPALLLFCATHSYIDLAPIMEPLYRRDVGAAEWLMRTLAGLPWWVHGPRAWDGIVQQQFWMGESDETYAMESDGIEDPKDYSGPTRKQVDDSLPAWAWDAIKAGDPLHLRKHRWHTRPITPEEMVNNLRMSARLAEHDIDAAGLFDSLGLPLARHPQLASGAPADVIDYPVRFGWKKGDWFEQALDDQIEVASNAGSGSQVFAWHPAADPARCAADYEAATLPLLRGLDRLCVDLDRYRKKRSPLLWENKGDQP